MSLNVMKTTGRTPETTRPADITNPITTLRGEIDRLFDAFFGRSAFDLDPFRRIGTTFTGWGDVTPHVDVKETDAEIEIKAELPGLDENDVTVTLRDGVLTMKGEKKEEREEKTGSYHLQERRFGSFERSFMLPDDVDADHIDARFEKGVLAVTMPKVEKPEKMERKIEVKPH